MDFAREILPILSNKCFACHGPDTKKAKDLRLDSYAAATKEQKGIRAIDPESPEDSELLFRIHDKIDPMPPEDEKPLTEAERELLSRWVKSGGNYASHWAFVPPNKKDAPSSEVIDSYIAAGYDSHQSKVTFAPEADRPTLARRAALVLTGLPPEPKLLTTFLGDRKPDAYERFVDQLLASSHYGEHQARYWLDAVRYGATPMVSISTIAVESIHIATGSCAPSTTTFLSTILSLGKSPVIFSLIQRSLNKSPPDSSA